MTTTAQEHHSETTGPMTAAQMLALVERHVAAEMAGDLDGALAVYTDDVVHDVVGAPHGPARGPDGARAFYEELLSNVTTREMTLTSQRYGHDFCALEHQAVVDVPGTFLGVPGQGRTVSFRMLHLFEFRGGLISRENIWLDGGSIVAQLTA